MNKSEILKALEWVDQTARDGDASRLAKAKVALEDALASIEESRDQEQAYKIAQESFVRKHGRDPLDELELVE